MGKSIRFANHFLGLSALLLGLVAQVNAQTTSTQVSSGSINSFNVNATSSFSVSTSGNSSPGVTAISEGSAVLLPGNTISTGVQCGSLCSATWNQEGSTNSISIQGINSSQELLLSPESTFKSRVDTSTADQTGNVNTGTATSGFTANTSLSVVEQKSVFTNTLTTSF
jgi:hypothetical protein